MQRILSLEHAPSIAVPLRFFLTAPLFALAAGLLLFWQGPALLVSRWAPGTLALTHLITLGFLSMTMAGALIQILHVLAGISLADTPLAAKAIPALLALGAATLAYGFLAVDPGAFGIAMPSLAGGFGWLIVIAMSGLRRAGALASSLRAIRLAVIGLACVVMLGVAAGLAFSGRTPVPMTLLANLHAAWGMMAWIGLLVVGVSYQVVPMFQVTELYPQRMMHGLARCIFAALMFWSIGYFFFAERHYPWSQLPLVAAVAAYAWFAVTTLKLIYRRKRPQVQATTMFWYLAMLSLLAAAALWLWAQFAPRSGAWEGAPLALGILVLFGFAYSLVNGMLYKIVPFLIWYHLQEKLGPRGLKAPKAADVIDDRHTRAQFWLHGCTLLLLLACVAAPDLAPIAGIALAADSGWLWILLLKAALRYRHYVALPPIQLSGAHS